MRSRWFRIVPGVSLLLAVFAGGILWVAQSEWLRERVRLAVISQAEKVTGGKAELGAFQWDWRTRTVQADRLVVRGNEPPTSPPLLSVDRVRARIRILSFVSRAIAIESIEAWHPRVHLIVDPTGTTNLPRPRISGDQPGLQALLDLKVGAFDLRAGALLLESAGQPPRNIPWAAHGENLDTHLTWDASGRRYLGTVSLDPLRVQSAEVSLSAGIAIEQDRIAVTDVKLRSQGSEIEIPQGEMAHFAKPVFSARYLARLTCGGGWLACPAGLSGSVTAQGRGRYVSESDYDASGALNGTGGYGKITGARFESSYDARPSAVTLHALRVEVLGGSLTGDVAIRDLSSWTAHGRAEHFDIRRLAALRTARPLPYGGIVSGAVDASGTLAGLLRGNLLAGADLRLEASGPGPAARGEIAVRYDATKNLVELGHSWLELPGTRLDVDGTPGSRLNVQARSKDMNDLRPALDLLALERPPAIAFQSATFEGTLTGPLTDPRISGHATATALSVEGSRFDAVAGEVSVSSAEVTVKNGVVSLGDVKGQGSGSLRLKDWRASDASAIAATVEIRNADITKVSAMAGQRDLPVTGTISAAGQISGTLATPLATADVTLGKGTIYSQPFDSITGRLQLIDRNTQSLTGLFVSGPKRVNITARFARAGTEFPAGSLDFNLTSNTMPLNQIALVRERQPDIHGFGKFHTDGTLLISHNAKNDLEFRLLAMNADASANSLELGGRNLGDARFIAQTKDGVVQARFDSNAAKAVIHGEGTVKLAGDYPVGGHVTFNSVGLNALGALIVRERDAANLNFDGEAQGEATISGPALHPEQLSVAVDLPRLEVRALPGSDFAKSAPSFAFVNDGPLRLTVAKSQVRIDSVHFKAPQTDLNLDGSVDLTGDAALNLRVRGDVNLAVARTFNKDLTASGVLSLNATVRGRWDQPDINGRALVRNADFRYADFSNGLNNANGEFSFNGSRATIQSFTAESGGGKVDVTGFAALTGGAAAFRFQAVARQVRIRYPEGVSSVSDADLTLFGTSQRSEISGAITLHRVSINPRSDTGTILESAAAPLQAPVIQAGLIANMNLDIKVQTAPDVALQTSVAQSIQGDAALTLRGTVANPAVLGRINITQGEMVFFGNKYAISQGSISFFNPVRIEPVINIDLETKARGVDVVLTVAGPMNKLGFSYRSDPPLQFADIVALLATGRAPGDPTSAAGSTGQSQNFQQLGASDLLGQAIANPVAGRLQRFFGVSRLKIDPQLTGVTGSPEARLTIEQQITPEILFTYITDVSSTSTQLIRVEWSFNRHWSAVLVREENGYVGLDFAYRKRFR